MKPKTNKKIKYLFVDLETKSRADITYGPTKYFVDADADWLICSAKLRGKPTKSYTNFTGGNKIPASVLNFTGVFVAHNWFFEWSFFKRFYPGTRAADFKNWICTAAMARWFGIAAPRAALADVVTSLGIGEKMPEGRLFIARYCVPDKNGFFGVCKAGSEDAKNFVRYCELDAELSEKIFDTLDGRGFNFEEFHAAQAIDVRGVPVDVDAARFLINRKEYDKANAVALAEKIAGRTAGGALVLSSNDAFVTFMQTTFDVEIPNARALTLDALDFSAHPRVDEIEHVLYVRKLLVARAGDKAQAILDRAHDGRVHNATVFHAAGTGRYQSWGVNFFNFSRQPVKDWEKEKETAPVPALQRGIVCARPGYVLIESDWRGIENYLSLFYAGDIEQLKRIEAGESPYLIFAEKMYKEKITKEDKRYTLAKASVLGFGYGARPKKFALINNFDLQTATVLHDAWTKINAPIVRLWKEFETAFSFALLHGKTTDVKGFRFEPLGKTSVKIILHDGHALYYRNLTVSVDDYGRNRIMRDHQPIHGGLLTENLMQATCARLLYRALVACERAGLDVVLHVYDSILIEAPFPKPVKKTSHLYAAKLEKIMKDPPPWAPDLRLAVDVKMGKRWSK